MRNNIENIEGALSVFRRFAVEVAVGDSEFRPGTGRYDDYVRLSRLCCGSLEAMSDIDEARSVLEILDVFASTGDPGAEAVYAGALLRDDKPWYSPSDGKRLLDNAFRKCDKRAPASGHILFLYGLQLFLGRGRYVEDVPSAFRWIRRAAELGYVPAVRFVPHIEAALKERSCGRSAASSRA